MDLEQDTKQLRRRLLEEVYAGACTGLGAMLLDEDVIRQADPQELAEIARRYGLLWPLLWEIWSR